MERVDEMTTPPVVGRYYLVPCVRWGRLWWPVQGPPHEDADLGVSDFHYHHDPRFWSSRQWDAMGGEFRGARVLGALIERAKVIDGPVHRRRHCHREAIVFPREVVTALWLPALEQAHATAKLRGACKVCPHRGLPLASLPVAADGTVICPGHGLRWDVSTGALVRR